MRPTLADQIQRISEQLADVREDLAGRLGVLEEQMHASREDHQRRDRRLDALLEAQQRHADRLIRLEVWQDGTRREADEQAAARREAARHRMVRMGWVAALAGLAWSMLQWVLARLHPPR